MTRTTEVPTADEMLEELAANIRDRHRDALRAFYVEQTPQGLVLRGQAMTFYGKQIAFHELLQWISDHHRIVANLIEVDSGDRERN